jgi:hypothetical protein
MVIGRTYRWCTAKVCTDEDWVYPDVEREAECQVTVDLAVESDIEPGEARDPRLYAILGRI